MYIYTTNYQTESIYHQDCHCQHGCILRTKIIYFVRNAAGAELKGTGYILDNLYNAILVYCNFKIIIKSNPYSMGL